MKREQYEAPLIEVIEIEVEKGFALSNADTGVSGNPDTPDALGHRGNWDDLW